MKVGLWVGLVASGTFALILTAQNASRVPTIWDDAALQDWATPVAGLNVRPAHYTSAEYYRVPADNLRTYPVYSPDTEPPGYWEALQKKKPEPLIDLSQIRTNDDWIAAGELAFREMDSFWSRTSDSSDIAQARDPRSFEGRLKLPDGSVFGPRWVVTSSGVMLSWVACSNCHQQVHPDGSMTAGGPRGPLPPGVPPVNPAVPGAQGSGPVLRRFFVGDSLPMAAWRLFSVPWAPDDRIETIRDTQQIPAGLNGGDRGVFNRPHGSPFFATKIVDLQNLRYSRYVDATATHRLRGPEDVARYAAFISGADPMDFGPHHMLSDEQRRVRFRYADEVLYAIGIYLMSLQPPKNPNTAPANVLEQGEEIFRRASCVNCHTPPNYTSGKLTVAEGFDLPANHPNRDDVVQISVGTDPGLALKTRKGTGFYKIPSLRGVWYRPRLLHDASLGSLEEMFDPARLSPQYEPKGWNPPGVTRRSVPGHTFGLSLNDEDRRALLAFLRSL